MSQKAIKVTAPGIASLVSDAVTPRLRDDYVIVKTKAVALNPTDYHHANFLSVPGATLGCDWSGVIQEVGKNVTRFKPGDEVFGSCHGGNSLEFEDGAFAEVIAAKEIATAHKPKQLSFEEAATFGVGIATAGQILHLILQLPFPPTEETLSENRGAILIYGGSSATGTILIQLAKLDGFVVYTTCSAPNFDLVKSRGADYVFDYNDSKFEDDITKSLEGKGESFKYVIDCIGSDETATISARLIAKEGSLYHSVKAPLPEGFKKVRTEDSVRAGTALAYTLLGETVFLPGIGEIPGDPMQEAYSKKWIPIIEELIAKGKIQPHPPIILPGGLEAIPGLLEKVAQGGFRGKKAVVSLA